MKLDARVSGQLRCLLAVAVLLVPIAVVAPDFVRTELNLANGSRAVFAPPYGVPRAEYNEALAAGVVEHVPAHASLAIVGAPLASYGMRWFAYVIAPRQPTSEPAQWTAVFGETPQQAHLHPSQAWQYGADWLVEN